MTFGVGVAREISGVVSGAGDLNYVGLGELTLSDASTTTGDITNTGGGDVLFSGRTTGGVANTSGPFDNPRRRHSALCWKSPVAFKRKVAKTSTWGGTKPRQVQFAPSS